MISQIEETVQKVSLYCELIAGPYIHINFGNRSIKYIYTDTSSVYTWW